MIKKGLVALVCCTLIISIGCGRKSKYTDFQLGEIKLVGENMPIDAIEYLERSIDKEPATRTKAQALLVIAYRRAMEAEIAKMIQAAEQFKGPEQQVLADLKQKGPEAAEKIIEIINERNRIQKDAAQLLTELGSSAVDPIITALGDSRFARIQDVCLDILDEIGTDAVDGLIVAAENESLKTWVRARAIQALGRIQDPKAIPVLEKLQQQSADESLKMEATVALYKLGQKEYETDILDALENSEYILARRTAARAVSNFNSFPTDRIIGALDDPDEQVRWYLVTALTEHSDPSALEPLTDVLLNDPAERVKNAARAALANYGEPVATRMVKELPEQEDWKIRVRIVSLLQEPKVIGGITRNGAYKLYTFYQNETHPTVKEALNRLLHDERLPQP